VTNLLLTSFGHLLGRVSIVAMVNSTRGERLRIVFEQIAW
jgi:hypothetical protein